MSWKKVTGNLGQAVRWTVEPKDQKQAESTVYVGGVIEGQYIELRENVGMNSATIYMVQTEKHGVLSVWDTTVLRDKMAEVPVGSLVRITCLGDQVPKKGGKAYVGFDVEYDDSPRFKEAKGNLTPESQLPPVETGLPTGSTVAEADNLPPV